MQERLIGRKRHEAVESISIITGVHATEVGGQRGEWQGCVNSRGFCSLVQTTCSSSVVPVDEGESIFDAN